MTNEVVAVGGGPAGLRLGCELRLAGVETVPVRATFPAHRPLQSSCLQARTIQMLDHRGLLERFSRGTVAPPFLNFGMFRMDLRPLDFDKLNLVF